MQAPNLPGQQGLQQQGQNLQGVMPINNQMLMAPAANSQAAQQQQLQLLMRNPQAVAQLLQARGLPPNILQQQQLQLQLQQQQQQQQQRPMLPGANLAQQQLTPQQQQQLAQQHLAQQQLIAQQLALRQQQQQQAQLQPAAAAAGAAARPALPQPAQLPGAAAAAQPAINTTSNFTPEQLETLKDQIMVFKKHKKGAEPVTVEELAKCKPKPLPAVLQPRPPQIMVPPAAAVAAATAQAQAAGSLPSAGGAPVRPANAAALPLQGIRPQVSGAMGGIVGAQQQQQPQIRPAGSLGRGAPAGAAGVAAPGRPLQPVGRAGVDGAAVAVKAEPPAGPSHPPLDEPVRRPAGPVLSIAAEAPGTNPTLAVDVPLLMRREYHKRLQAARSRRQHELDALLRSGRLQVGHCRAPDGTPGRSAVIMELRKLKLYTLQSKLRMELEREQADICQMPERDYKIMQKNATKYMKQLELAQQQQQHQRWAQQLQQRQAVRKLSTEKANMFKEMHMTRNKYLARFHERLASDAMTDADRRNYLLQQHDFNAYRELLRQIDGPQTNEDRYKEVDEFLKQTENYIRELIRRLVSAKAKEEAQEAAQEAIAEARIAELSEEEVKARAEAAYKERLAQIEAQLDVDMAGDAQSLLTALAHSVSERISRAPAYLKPPGNGKLRDYQLKGLEWMVSLYNNKLNGILADEMGLGKTVQVMALLAYLYEFKQNYGPHLIIVPNAVMVNWKAELKTWLPDMKCVYYAGSKEARHLQFQQEVQSMHFNILVTTYETIMRDRNKLSKLDWKYIIIDEAQRMKDRESKLSQDLNKFTTARRLLLTGTPLQNELKELWSLLNLLLPEVFNDQAAFSDWFTRFLGNSDGKLHHDPEASAMDREKRVLVVNRLHQILSPFMLRRMVKDVETQLPEKIAITVKCPMSAYQSAIYNWIKATNTVRTDPVFRRVAHANRAWEPLQNKVVELRKVCNHPRLCYPQSEDFWQANVVRTCGKMYWLDQMLVKLYATGHRVLLFSTMTKMLDTVEFYLNWRQVNKNDGSGEKTLMKWRRIDGSTVLEGREKVIQEFNAPDSDVFIFLLSIRAAGRGLNLQAADTVIVYDPDANPKNEEQAIARSHRIGQKKEVRVLHLEAVTDPAEQTTCFPPSYFQPRRGDIVEQQQPAAAAAAGAGAIVPAGQQGQQVMFADSVESLLRNVVQKQKIDMANEVIDAGMFDNLTNDAERRQKLEAMLLDEDRNKTATNQAPTKESFNRQLARTDLEFETFQEMDKDPQTWLGELVGPEEVPDFLHYTAGDVKEVLKVTERKPTRVGILAQAERRQQEKAAAAAAAAAAAGATGKPPLPPGVRPSQSTLSLQGAAGTSYVSGAGEEGEEEVVGGVYDDIEEEQLDDRNIDEEFERELERQEGRQPSGANSSRDGTPGKQQAASGPAAAAAGSERQQSPFASQAMQQQQQQQQPSGGEAWEDVQGAYAAGQGTAQAGMGSWQQQQPPQQQQQQAWQQQDQQGAWQQQQHEWQQWQQQSQQHQGANGAAHEDKKRSWAEAAAADGDYGASGGPTVSEGPSNSHQQPSASTGGGVKRIKLKGFRPSSGSNPPDS